VTPLAKRVQERPDLASVLHVCEVVTEQQIPDACLVHFREVRFRQALQLVPDPFRITPVVMSHLICHGTQRIYIMYILKK
jgi:hypothetical protein